MARDGDLAPQADEDNEEALPVSIEFLMVSGERFTVQEFVEGDPPDAAVRKLGEQLALELKTDRVRQFVYWEDEDFFFDVVRMDQVSAFSISLVEDEAEEDEV